MYIRQTKVPTAIWAPRPNFLYVFTHIMWVIFGQRICWFMPGLGSWLYWYFAFEEDISRCFKGKMGLNYLPSPAIIQQFFWPIMTLIICVQTYKKFGLVAKIGVGTFVCLIYIQNVNQKFKTQTSQKIQFYLNELNIYLMYYHDFCMLRKLLFHWMLLGISQGY